MGRTKQLLRLGDKPVINHCIDALIASSIREIVVVISSKDNGIADTVRGLTVTVAINPVPESDMAGSARTGISAISRSASGILLCLSDYPLVLPETITMLIAEHAKSPDKIMIPSFNGKRGHPSLFPSTTIRDIFSGGTLRDIIRKTPQRVVTIECADEGVVLDMDTPEDYQNLVRRVQGSGINAQSKLSH